MSVKPPVLILFAKKPIEGKVKTRLSPPLSFSQAKDVAVWLINHSIENAVSHWPGEIELCLWPDSQDKIFKHLQQMFSIGLSTQSYGDLGEKMYASLSQKTKMGQSAMIMGCDVPQCNRQILESAFAALKQHKNVIGPTFDGGFYCISVNKPQSDMFANVDWGSCSAYQQTRLSCTEAGIKFDVVLPELTDLDDYNDLEEIAIQTPQLNRFRFK